MRDPYSERDSKTNGDFTIERDGELGMVDITIIDRKGEEEEVERRGESQERMRDLRRVRKQRTILPSRRYHSVGTNDTSNPVQRTVDIFRHNKYRSRTMRVDVDIT